MNIELVLLDEGGVMMVTDKPLPSVVKRVEFYREQNLMMLVYNNEDIGSELMHYEIPDNFSYPIEKAPNILIYSLFKDHEPIGYKAPLIKVGDIH